MLVQFAITLELRPPVAKVAHAHAAHWHQPMKLHQYWIFRPLTLCVLIVCVTSLNCCKTYTTTLEQGRSGANETVATTTLRTIASAQTAYSVTNGGDYGTFEQLAAGDYLDKRFDASAPKLSGYVLTMTVSPKSSGASESFYNCRADPDPANNPGRHFYIDSTSQALHVNATQPASANDELLQP